MFFDDENDGVFLDNPELYHIVTRELYAFSSTFENLPQVGSASDVPTHTEDGIPIRKLYVSNLPPKTSRTELFGLFAQYGFIKSCWLRMGERGPSKSPTPTYAFVTYSNPADAHKALKAPYREKCLRGRQLRISPADSWHQPIQDPDGRVRWKVRTFNLPSPPANNEEGETSAGADDAQNVEPEFEQPETTTESEGPINPEDKSDPESYDILDILNRDCLDHILSYVPILDIIRTERVSKRWQTMAQEHLEGRRTFKTSWWGMAPSSLTTAVLRRVLQKLGSSLTRLHIDHHWSALNDRTAHIVGKFCPNLEEFKVTGMHTKNWNPLIYGCKMLKNLKFVSCNKLTDASLVQIVKNDSSIESLTIANNTHVTGLFLTGATPPKLNSLSFYNCYSLQGSVLCGVLDNLPLITTLRLDLCPISIWKIIPKILKKLPKLEELSLSEYTSVDCLYSQNIAADLSNSITTLTELKVLNLSKNIYVTNAVLKQVAQSCAKLEMLNISSCNPRKTYPGIGDESMNYLCNSCKQLQRLDVSYLAALSDTGLAACARLPALRTLVARGNPALTARPIVACLSACPVLQEVDVCGCDSISEEVVCAAVLALDDSPRLVTLHLAGTAATESNKEIPTHKYLTVNMEKDLSNPNLRPDFMDNLIYEHSSEDSLDDIYDHEAFNDFFAAEDELFLDDEDFQDYDDIAYGLHGPDIILL